MTSRLRRTKGYRILAASALGRRLRRVLRQSPLVREQARFIIAGLMELPGIHPYRLRPGGEALWLRHPVDSWTFHEVFVRNVYRTPAAVSAVLPARGPAVLDLGANVGLFGLYARRELPGCRIIGYEPDPENVAVLRRNLEAGLEAGWYELVVGAAGVANRKARFAFGLGDKSHEAETGSLVAVHDVLPRMAGCDLVKVDIEGGEWDILGDPRLAALGPKTIVLEYHAARCPGGEPLASAVGLLSAAGYEVLHQASETGDSDQGMLWAVHGS
jgi:FkbM family methyltransferase